ncbi:MAG: AAA family ATPase [Candidatus Aminicenantes bacterium]|nr:AAA family ATPase [Candidatus Aminicenantes bacterium]
MTTESTPNQRPLDDEQAFRFAYELQRQIVAMLLIAPERMGENLSAVRPEHFDNPILSAMVKLLTDFLHKYSRVPSVTEMEEEITLFLENNSKRFDAVEFMKVFGDVLDDAESDFRYVADKTLEFIQDQAWIHAVLDSAADATKAKQRGKRPDYEKLSLKILTAATMRTAGDELMTVEADSIEPTEITWLWPERIPLGKLTLLVGDPESGKSLFTTWMAAHVTTASRWPDLCTPPVGRVLILQSEDGQEDTVLPRLIQYGADRSKVTFVPGVKTTEGQERMFTLLQDIDKLKKEIVRRGDVKPVILDPVQGYFGGALSGKVNTNSDAHMRAILTPLKTMAEETGVAVVGVAHLNKSSQMDMMYRIGGSIGIMGVARSVWLIRWNRDPDGVRYFQSMKSNRKAGIPGLAFNINKGNGDVTFLDVPVPTAIELLSSTFGEAGAAEVQGWLREQLASGPKSSKEILEAAEQEGFSPGMVYRAKKSLGLKKPQRIGGVGRGHGYWEWSLT